MVDHLDLNSLIQLPAPFDCFLILYADKSMALSVKLTISIALLFPEPSTYSEKNNSVPHSVDAHFSCSIDSC